MITPDGWFDWAIKHPGPQAKSGYGGLKDSDAQGVVYHSAEGYRATLLALVDNMQREASWTASNMKNGDFIQHYPATRIVWTNGSKQANILYRGIESEGMAGEPLTDAQVANLTRCAQDMAEFFNWPAIERKAQLWEHNEMKPLGSLPTACPSGRIPWDKVLGGLDMPLSTQDLQAIREIVKQEMEVYIGDPAYYTQGRKVLEFLNESDNWVVSEVGRHTTEEANRIIGELK